jgi:urocanate hydratase
MRIQFRKNYQKHLFRWVCASNLPEDLRLTDKIACDVLEELIADKNGKSKILICTKLLYLVDPDAKKQYTDNKNWIVAADAHKLVVGSQARILYSDQVTHSICNRGVKKSTFSSVASKFHSRSTKLFAMDN